MTEELEWDRVFALEQAADDEEMLAELLVLFRDSSASDLEKINSGLVAGDPAVVADAAHSIKGAAASLGIEGIRKIAAELEKQGRAGGLADGAALAARLAGLLKAFESVS